MGNNEIFEAAQAVCEALSPAEDEVTRELMTRLSDKWSLWVMALLAEAGRPVRFSRVLEGIGEISQKSLTKTLRQLERDGLVTRQMFLEVPPRVEYNMTPLGMELLKQVEPLWTWVAQNAGVFQTARASFDGRGRGETASGEMAAD